MTKLKDNRANKTISCKPTLWVDRLVPFQLKVVHAADRAIERVDNLSRNPSQSNGSDESKTNTEESLNNWLMVNAITKCEFVSAFEKNQNTLKQPIRANVAKESELQGSEKATSEGESANVNKQTIKDVVLAIDPAVSSDSMQKPDGHAVMRNAVISAANRPPVNEPVCFLVNQTEVGKH